MDVRGFLEEVRSAPGYRGQIVYEREEAPRAARHADPSRLPAPAVRRTMVVAKIPLPTGTVSTAGRVVFTNVPGNLMKRSLPVGMAVRFEGTPPETEALLQVYAEVRHCTLEVRPGAPLASASSRPRGAWGRSR